MSSPSYDVHSAQSNSARQRPTKTRQTFDIASQVPGGETFKNLPPIRWVVELIQQLVAVMILAIANMIRLTFRKEKAQQRQR